LHGYLAKKVKNGEQLWELSNSHAKGDDGKHEGRRWESIYPSGPGPVNKAFKNVNEMKHQTQPLVTLLEEKLFTHEFYARNAASRKFYACNAASSQEQILIIDHINMFTRDNTLQERQSLHVDAAGIGVVAIYVERCGSTGYSFYYIKKSHNREKHDRTIWVPKATVTRLAVNQGDLLVFSPALIHSGGEASSIDGSTRDGNRDLDCFTDVSFQFTFAHNSFPSSFGPGYGAFQPFERDELKHETAEYPNKRYKDAAVDINTQKFQEYIDEGGTGFKDMLESGFKQIMAKLAGQKVRSSRKSLVK
jgi:hypothetical protein